MSLNLLSLPGGFITLFYDLKKFLFADDEYRNPQAMKQDPAVRN